MTKPFVRREQPLQPQHLLDDLAGREVAIDAVEPAGAEDAAHAATDLRADADRATDFVAQEHALNLAAVRECEQQLFGAIVGLRVSHDACSPESE